jgi:DnaK suppressor protein
LENLDLGQFKELLENRKEAILENLNSLKISLNNLSQVDICDDGDFASISIDSHTDQMLITLQEKELEEIEEALSKLVNDFEDFGVCEMCSEDIQIERLEIKPHAKYCRTCRDIAEKNQKS